MFVRILLYEELLCYPISALAEALSVTRDPFTSGTEYSKGSFSSEIGHWGEDLFP